MAYVKQTWINNSSQTPVSGARLSHIENGISNADITTPGSDAQNYLAEVLSQSGSDGKAMVSLSDYYTTTAPPADFTEALQQAIIDADGRMVWVDEGDYPVALDITDLNVFIQGPGRLLQQKGAPAIKVTHSFTGEWATSHSRVIYSGYSVNKAYEIHSIFTVPVDKLQTVQAGDVLFLSTQDFFRARNTTTSADTDAANFLSVGTLTTLKTFDAAHVPVLGFGIPFTGGPDISNGNNTTAMTAKNTVNGKTLTASSGATATITASTTDLAGQKVLIVQDLDFTNGTFASGNTLTVGGVSVGTMSGLPFLIMDGTLITNPTASPVLHTRPRDLTTILDVNIGTVSNTDEILAAPDDRQAAIDLVGVLHPVVRARIDTSYAAGIRLRSTFRAVIDLDIRSAPNNAYDSEQAYGYGVNEGGASEYTFVCRLVADKIRHGYTSNVQARTLYPLAEPTVWTTPARMQEAILSTGVPKWGHVTNFDIRNSYGAGIDTHAGAWYMRFSNGRVAWPANGGRRETESLGIQNRAFNSSFVNIEIIGAVDAIKEYAHRYPAHMPWVNRYEKVNAHGWSRYGFSVTSTAAPVANGVGTDAYTWSGAVEFNDCRSVGSSFIHAMGTTAEVMYQAAYYLAGTGASVSIFNCHAAGFNGAALLTQSGALKELVIDGFRMDFRYSPAGTSPIRFEITPTTPVAIDHVTAISNTTSALTAMLRLESTNMNINYGSLRCINRAGVALLWGARPGNATAVMTKMVDSV